MRKDLPSHRVKITRIKFQHGIAQIVLEHLDKNEPILLPLQSPLPYIVVGRSPNIVNGVKGRPDEQAVARLCSSFEEIEPYLQMLTPEAISTARELLLVEHMTVLLPIRREYFESNAGSNEADDLQGKRPHPKFLQRLRSLSLTKTTRRKKSQEKEISVQRFKQTSSTIRNNMLKMDLCRRNSTSIHYCLFHASLAVRNKQKFCSQSRPLYGSSSNVSGHKYAQTLDGIISQFQQYNPPNKNYHLLVLDAEHLRSRCKYHESTSMVRISPTGHVKKTRDGIHDHPIYKDSKIWRVTEEKELKDWQSPLDVYKADHNSPHECKCKYSWCFLPLSFFNTRVFTRRQNLFESFQDK